MPKINPVASATNTATQGPQNVITVSRPVMILMMGGVDNPTTAPITAPDADNTNVSTKNCNVMSDFFAPSARRIPISPVRSLTVASMMFIIPMPPTNNEIAAILPKTKFCSCCCCFACSSKSSGIVISKSRFSCVSASRLSIAAAVRLTCLGSVTLTVSWLNSNFSAEREPSELRRRTSPIRFWSVVNGM